MPWRAIFFNFPKSGGNVSACFVAGFWGILVGTAGQPATIGRLLHFNPIMYLVLIAWFYVTLMMAVAEATSAQGTVLGAIVTFALYGLLPMAIVGYILGTPARKRAIRAREQAQAASAADPDAGGHAPAGAEDGAVAPVRKEP